MERNNIPVGALKIAVQALGLTLVDLLERASRVGDVGAVTAVERLVMERQRSAEDVLGDSERR